MDKNRAKNGRQKLGLRIRMYVVLDIYNNEGRQL